MLIAKSPRLIHTETGSTNKQSTEISMTKPKKVEPEDEELYDDPPSELDEVDSREIDSREPAQAGSENKAKRITSRKTGAQKTTSRGYSNNARSALRD